MSKKTLTPEMREYFREIGRVRGNALKEKYGSDYFRQIAAKRKTFGRKPMEKNSVVELAKRFDVSRQRMYQILELNKNGLKESDFESEGLFREAVATAFFNDKTAEETLDK